MFVSLDNDYIRSEYTTCFYAIFFCSFYTESFSEVNGGHIYNRTFTCSRPTYQPLCRHYDSDCEKQSSFSDITFINEAQTRSNKENRDIRYENSDVLREQFSM